MRKFQPVDDDDDEAPLLLSFPMGMPFELSVQSAVVQNERPGLLRGAVGSHESEFHYLTTLGRELLFLE